LLIPIFKNSLSRWCLSIGEPPGAIPVFPAGSANTCNVQVCSSGGEKGKRGGKRVFRVNRPKEQAVRASI